MQEAQQRPSGSTRPCVHLHSPAPACTDDFVRQTTAAHKLQRPTADAGDMFQEGWGERVASLPGMDSPTWRQAVAWYKP